MTPNPKPTTAQVASFIDNYNQWRRGTRGFNQPDPKQIGYMLDHAVNHLLNIKPKRRLYWSFKWSPVPGKKARTEYYVSQSLAIGAWLDLTHRGYECSPLHAKRKGKANP